MLLSQLCSRINVLSPSIVPDIEIASVRTDSRAVHEGDLFVALEGTRVDGHCFINEAVANKAAAVVVNKSRVPENCRVPVIETDDTHAAAAYLHSAYYNNPADKLKIIAITGTNGKTSVTYILRSILKSAGYRVGLIGTVRILIPPDSSDAYAPDEEFATDGGSELSDMPAAMTTPDPAVFYRALAEMKRRMADYVIIEATSHSLHRRKLEPVKPFLSVFTNLSPEHLDYHCTMDNYLAAKAKLFVSSPVAVVNASDEYESKLEKFAPNCRYIRCKTTQDSEKLLPAGKFETIVSDVKSLGVNGVEYLMLSRGAVMRIRCPVPGDYTVQNTVLAVRAALALGIDALTIQDSVRVLRGVEGRLQRVKTDATKSGAAVFIDYAHTPAALENMLTAVRKFTFGRLILLFGCGGDRDKSKRPVMGQIASRLSDYTIISSDNCRTENPDAIISDIMAGFDKTKEHTVIINRHEAIIKAVDLAGEGDVLILAGKGHEKYDIDAHGKHYFDEEEIVKSAFELK